MPDESTREGILSEDISAALSQPHESRHSALREVNHGYVVFDDSQVLGSPRPTNPRTPRSYRGHRTGTSSDLRQGVALIQIMAAASEWQDMEKSSDYLARHTHALPGRIVVTGQARPRIYAKA